MAYEIGDDGFIHRFIEAGPIQQVGDNLSHIGTGLPQRYDSFSAGYAFGGLAMGGAAGFLTGMVIRLFTAAASAGGTFEDIPFDRIFRTETGFPPLLIILAALFAIAGFFWDGFESTGERFLVSMGSFGLILGGLTGILPALLISMIIDLAFSLPETAGVMIFLSLISLTAVTAFIWNGIESCRDTFSIFRSFLGVLCGICKGILKCLALVFTNGCFVIILAIIFSAITSVIAVLIIIYYAFKGFFILGTGGDWSEI